MLLLPYLLSATRGPTTRQKPEALCRSLQRIGRRLTSDRMTAERVGRVLLRSWWPALDLIDMDEATRHRGSAGGYVSDLEFAIALACLLML